LLAAFWTCGCEWEPSNVNEIDNSKMKHRKGWDDTTNDLSQFQLNEFEQLQRKASRVSKNIALAREELRSRQEDIRKGKLPEGMKKLIEPPKKKYTACASAIAHDPKRSNNKPTATYDKT
jgi:hypothetical protein